MLLAPSAIGVRRPSGEADRILSGIEPGAPFCPGRLPASDSVQSVPLCGQYWTQDGGEDDDVAGSTEIRPEGNGGPATTTTTAEEKEEEEEEKEDDASSFGTLGISPDARVKHWPRRSSQGPKGDPGAGPGSGPGGGGGGGESGGFRRASLSLRRSIDSMLCTLATKPPARGGGVHAEKTRLSMEVIQESPIVRRRIRSKQKGKNLDKLREDAAAAADGDGSECPSSVPLSLTLVLVSLKDGVLSAEIAIGELQRIPHGHVRIRIRNYNLEVCVTEERGTSSSSSQQQRESGGKEKQQQQQQQPWYRGSVSIPIYVNPSSLQFRLDDSRGVVHLEGRIKGCCTRMGTSLSAMELSRSAAASSVVTGNGSS